MKKKLSVLVFLLLFSLLLTGCSFNISIFGHDINIDENSFDNNNKNTHQHIEFDEDEIIDLTVNQDVKTTFNTSDKVSKELLLAFAQKYDSDAYAILSKVENSNTGHDILEFYNSDDTVAKEFDTSVHEMCHVTNETKSTFSVKQFSIYTGDGKWTNIRAGKSAYFPSSEIADYIPKECQTFRYKTYIHPDNNENLGSVINGCFGLLDEFSAYCWGNKASLSSYNYIKSLDLSYEDCKQFFVSYANRSSYAEFKYYILTYLLYAEQYHPDVYKEIMSNTDFLYAFNRIDAEFHAVINTFAFKVNEYVENHDNVYISDGSIWFKSAHSTSLGLKIESPDYDLLMEKLKEPEYAQMCERMKNY